MLPIYHLSIHCSSYGRAMLSILRYYYQVTGIVSFRLVAEWQCFTKDEYLKVLDTSTHITIYTEHSLITDEKI